MLSVLTKSKMYMYYFRTLAKVHFSLLVFHLQVEHAKLVLNMYYEYFEIDCSGGQREQV